MASNPAMAPDRPKVIAFADPSSGHRRLIETALSRAGYKVVGYDNAVDLISELDEIEPDAVVLETSLPSMDGFEACSFIQEFHGDRNIPVLFFTNDNEADAIKRARDAGGTDYLMKPSNPKRLAERVHRCILSAGSLQQVY